ncbi:PREDICTED: uncharacterized protein LOC104698984 [Camelina sativa]|uniref:Uncharacterized protein LOC104698984 n=1 Tax=Camelina sativa TaxID=90675 RepID=A0ABM0SKV1_CAMSA|nr:PREDICTED: uncharacterized protein LOC104698984 [Camelina sativa]
MVNEEESNASALKFWSEVQLPDAPVVSPYTLSSSDNPRAMISSVLLTGDNYNKWATEMLNALQAKQKTGFINGAIVQPARDDPDYENWLTVNSMIVGWLRTSIEPKVRSTVTFITNSHHLWSDLKQRFSVGNKVRVHQIQGQLASCRQEGQSVIDVSGGNRHVGFLAHTDVSGGNRPDSILNKGRLSCSHCGCTGHEKRDCWQLVGFPDWWTEHNEKGPNGRGTSSRGRGGRGSSPAGGGHGRDDHLRALTQLLQEKSTNANPSPAGSDKLSGKLNLGNVILDTGASHHMTGTLSLLTDVVPIQPSPVGFADGSKAFAVSVGVFPLSNNVKLTNVLFVPSLNCTLISDHFSKNLIGSGEEHDGVYYLTDVATTKIHMAKGFPDQALWHRRLGHPSFSVLSALPQFKRVYSSVSSSSCEYTERQFGKTVKTVRSDNGTEFMCLASYFRENGIIHQTSCVGTPQQNGRVERKHLHILNVARALLFQASLPIKFWGEAVLTAAYLINQTPSSIQSGCSPYEILHKSKPDYDQLRVFGSACYVHRLTRDKDKFGQRSRVCVFVGYPFGKKGWKVFDIERNEFLVSCDVVFQENVFTFATSHGSSPLSVPPLVVSGDDDWLVPTLYDRGSPATSLPSDQDNNTGGDLLVVGLDPMPSSAPPIVDNTEDVSSVHPDSATPLTPAITGSPDSPDSVSAIVSVPQSVPTPPSKHCKSIRTTQPSVRLQDYVLYNATHTPSHHALPGSPTQSSTLVQGTSPYPLTDFVSDENFSPSHHAYLAVITANTEPKHFKEAVKIKVWNDAVVKEVDALELLRTWDVCDLPPGKIAIGCQWVFKNKYNFDGMLERHKARLVALGNTQVEGEDYRETFAPVVRMTTVRTLLRLVAANQWKVYQMDVHNAFLHGDLEEDEASSWFSSFSSWQSLSPSQVSVWFKTVPALLNIELRVLIYVDDLIICGNDGHMLTKFKEYLGRCFAMKDLGKLKYFLGIEVSRGPDGIFLTQRKYALDIIADTGNLGSRPGYTPLEQNHRLASDDGPLLLDPKPYRRLESPGQGIMLKADMDLSIDVYCDSDWSSCPKTRRSLSAYVVLLGGSPIAWKAKKQDTVSHSSTEVEYRAMSFALKEIKWLHKLLKGFGINRAAPTRLFCDSKAAIHIASNPVFHERTKHIENDCHAVRDAVRDGIITTEHVRTTEQLADIFTKTLGRDQFHYIMSKLGVQDLHTPT